MKISDKDTGKIFELLSRIRDEDPDARKEAAAFADQIYYWEEQNSNVLLVFEHCEVDRVQKCFAGYRGGASSFYIPSGFKIRNVTLDNRIYTFVAEDGRSVSAGLEEIGRMWDLIPLGAGRVNESYIDWAFSNCSRKKDTADYTQQGIGEFTFAYGTYTFDEYQSKDHSFSIIVHVDDVKDLHTCLSEIDPVLRRIPELDSTSRKELAAKLSITKEELEMISLDALDYYRYGEFDLTYCLPEDSAVEYVRVCYSKEGLPVEATFGNF
ncbi:hypothetical protein [Pedobacter caeni]|uniref:Uncharacterized protein n=1 Tax=Pedobacter caeni TaxID=288992 RepID=A0A1M4UAS3_9SPHI|nr:hypothetical protein [Pedobacter caeni]SHE53825.1 hypothetical protein SAMN04488522_101491 [Pedobacter caeni]